MVQDLIPNIENLISEKDIAILEKLLNQILNDNINYATDRINNNLVLNKTTGEVVKKSLKQFYASKQYQNSLAKYLINVKTFSDAKIEMYAKDGLQIEVSKINKFQKLAITEHLDYLTENGLNAKFNQPLRQIIYNNINSGISQTELENKLKQYISDGKDISGKLSSYIKQVAIQGADAYSSIIDQKITEKYIDKVTGFIVTGSLIESSSPQCKYCVKDLNRLIKKEDWETIKSKAVGLIDGTTFENLPTLKLHWGCRHSFTPKIS